MNKKIKVTSAAAAVLASLVLANANVNNEVKADTKPVNPTAKTTEKAQTPEEAARANVASAQKNVETEQGNVDKAKDDLDQAKKDAEKPDADYKTQSNKVDGLKKTVDQKNDALTDAKNKEKDAKALVDEANNSAKVQAAKDAVTKQNGVVKNANDAKDKADQAVTGKQGEIDKLDKAVKTDTQDVNDKTAAKNQADQAVTDIKNQMSDTGFKQAVENLSNANAAVEQDKKDITQNKKDIEELSTEKENKQTAYNTVKTERDRAQTKRDQAQATYESSERKSKEAAKDVTNKKAEITKLKDQKTKIDSLLADQNNKIIIRDKEAYRKAYADYMNGNLSDEDKAYLDQAINENRYVSSAKAAQESVDVNNLTDAQIKEVSLFAAYLHNQVRQELGLKPNDVVTDGSVKFAKEVADGYRKDNWSIIDKQGHDNKLINELSTQNGLTPYEDNSGQKYENAYVEAASDLSIIPTTMDDLRELVFKGVNSMIFGSGAQYEFDHARGVLGAEFDNPDIVAEGADADQDKIDELKEDLVKDPNSEDYDFSLYGKIAYIQNSLHNMREGNKQYPGTWSEKDFQEKQAEIKKLEIKAKKEAAQLKKLEAQSKEPKGLPHYIGANFVYLINSNEATPYEIQVHFEDGMTPSELSNDSTHEFNTNVVPSNDSQSNSLEGQIKSENGILDQLKKDAVKASQKAEQDKSARDKAKNELDEKQGIFTRADSALAQVTQKLQKAEERKTDLERKLGNDTQTKQAAQTTFNKFKQTHEQLFNAYKEALANQTATQKQLDKANDTLTQTKTKLAKAQKDLPTLKQTATEKGNTAKDEQTKLDSLKQHVEDLKNAKTILADAKKAVTDAEKAYDTAKKNYDDANEVLNGDLKTNKDKADAKVAAAQKAYDEADAKLQTAKSKLAQAQQKLQDILDAEYAQSIIASTPVETKKEDKQEPVKTPEVAKETETKTKVSTAPKKIRLTHNAFVYNKHGKLVRKGLYVKMLKRGKTIKALKNAKIVTIKGKKYYQIGKNYFIKVANTKLTTHKVHIKVRIKGNKKIKMYNRAGKFNKHYARPNHTYTFNEKAKIHGKTYYKIADTNNWIPAKKLALKK
ncbi:SEC10/PgrA surface exclusion domain-containing protein [Lactobacillus gallinarum]|uniref:SEC10/PgrA surface exclusion domain-containing protein n=1 Tax=Lactobacillus gallinarum TaxID=52242 RepID=UPI000B56BDD4|nr:SEC10/PgrA surface exclusion domain-containing protein [Lactobacillus gallinarum]OUQ00559.1 hypothetical protein B5E95_05765 [Lactobacillus gallinarum]